MRTPETPQTQEPCISISPQPQALPEGETERVSDDQCSCPTTPPPRVPQDCFPRDDWEARYRAKAQLFIFEALDILHEEPGREQQALALGERALKYLENLDEPKLRSEALEVVGRAKGDLEQYEEALKALDESLQIRMQVYEPEHNGIGNVYLFQGIVHRQKGDNSTALYLFRKHLEFNQGQGGWCESVAVSVKSQCIKGYTPAWAPNFLGTRKPRP